MRELEISVRARKSLLSRKEKLDKTLISNFRSQ